MKRLLALLILLTCAATGFSQTAILDTSNTAPGRYYAQIDVGQDGSVMITQIKQIVRLDGKPTPPPQPDVLTARAAAIKTAALKATADPNRDKTALELAALYREVGKKVTAGELKGADSIAMVAKGTVDMLLNQRNAAAAWQPMRDTMTAQWTAAIQEGAKDADLVKLLGEVADGLTASVQTMQAIDIDQIIKLILLIMELLKPFL